MSASGTRAVLARLTRLGPGIAIAATGVGAGDLIAASVGGVRFGMTLAWAVALGAILKYVLNEGIARWQLGQGRTLLEALVERFHPLVSLYLALYLLLWTPITAAALAAACGIATRAIWPALPAPAWGMLHAAAACALVLLGGYRLLERSMKGLIALMFVSIVGSALWLRPDPAPLARGLLLPAVPPGGLAMVLSVMGGVGGSVTLLAYGYWIEEKGWRGRGQLGMARLDLGVAYGLTGLFGIAVLVLAASLPGGDADLGTGTGLLVGMADRIGGLLGPAGRAVFLLGVWGAVFTSMLGVWHGVPSMLADFLRAAGARWRRGRAAMPAAAGRDRLHAGLVAGIAGAASLLVWAGQPVELILVYTVIGSLFMPLLAFLLLRLNGGRGPQSRDMRNRPLTVALLLAALLLFAFLGAQELLAGG